VRYDFGSEITVYQGSQGLCCTSRKREPLYLSGASDDPVYNLAVVLDTVGDRLSNPPIRLAQALANAYQSVNGKWDKHIGWPLGKVPSKAIEKIDILSAALDALVTVPNELNFFRNWALTQLSALLQENELIVEALIIIVGSPSDRFHFDNETVEKLTNSQEALSSVLTDPYPGITFLQSLSTINDPYVRFRGYLQLINYFPFLQIPFVLNSNDSSEIYSLIANVQEAACAIQNASHKAWAFEQLARISHPTQRKKGSQETIQVAQQISDPINRSRAYARLANSSSLEDGLELFSYALNDAQRINDERDRADTLLLLRQILNQYPQQYSHFQKVVTSLNSWNQNKISGLSAPLLQQYEADLEAIHPGTCSLILGAVINDLKLQPGQSHLNHVSIST
jgi:hypothetical protein